MVTDDYELIRRMCGARSRYVRDFSYVSARFDPPNDHVGSTINEKKHSELRAILSIGACIIPAYFMRMRTNYLVRDSTREKMFLVWKEVLTSVLLNS